MTTKTAGFVHLRTHSAYSLSEGAIKAEKLAALARDMKMPALALTDSGNLFGGLEFSQKCAAYGVQPILGCQINLTREDKAQAEPLPLVFLARNQTGLLNIQKLSSEAFLETEAGLSPQCRLEQILACSEGVFCLTGGAFGPLGQLFYEGNAKGALKLARQLQEGFGDYLAVELQRHKTEREQLTETLMIRLADELSLPLVATNEPFFAEESMFEAQDALLCIAEGKVMSDPNRRRLTKEHSFKSAEEMTALFGDLPDACQNTLEIARLCSVMVETRLPLLPVCGKVKEGATEEETLRRMAEEGLLQRLSSRNLSAEQLKIYQERLAYELSVISKMGFAGYFLIVADFIQWAKQQGIPVGPGRGSGAGSLVAYALTVTELDPLQFSLLFERFLNPERVSMPDFDIDFCQDRRDEVVAYVQREYGRDRVAHIITFGTLQARAAVRDVGRVLGLPYGQVNRVANLIPNNPAKPTPLAKAIKEEAGLQQLMAEDEAVAHLLEVAQRIEGLYRHAGTHAAGVVIADRPLTELVPLYRDPRSDIPVTQYSMKYVEQAGLVKFDFLGLTTLTIIERTLNYLREEGIIVDIGDIPWDDPATFSLLQKGDTVGVFQFEGQGMRDALRLMKPDRFEDLIAAVALYRPGPMENIPAYCARKHGEEKWQPPHPAIASVLEETYGIMVYQEQVMQIAQILAGYSLGAADLLRRAMGKKIRSEMENQRKIFTEGAQKNGLSATLAGEIFDLMAKFADYGFNKSHAAAYALVAYQTAWLKANYPEAFLSASMSLAIHNPDKLVLLRQEALRTGIQVLPPDINKSGADFRPERGADGKQGIRYALAAIKKVSYNAMRETEKLRGQTPFKSIDDFCKRIDPSVLNRGQIENLIKAGAFDTLDPNRGRLFAATDLMLQHAQLKNEERESGQNTLFGDEAAESVLIIPPCKDWLPSERLANEAEAVGFHLTAHPLDAYRKFFKRQNILSSRILESGRLTDGAEIELAGTVVRMKERMTRTGNRMAFVAFSDQDGSFEVTFFSEVLAGCRPLLTEGKNLIIGVDVRVDGESLRITASRVSELEEKAAAQSGIFRVRVAKKDAVAELHRLLSAAPVGRGRIILVPEIGFQQNILEAVLPFSVRLTPELFGTLKLIEGVTSVEED